MIINKISLRYAAFIAALTYISLSSTSLFAQRKDSDAKISHSNYVRAAIGQRVKVSDAKVRIRYAFNPEDIKDKSTWIDEGQLKIAPDMTDYSSFFVEVNEDSLARWFDTHGRNVAYPPARWIQGHRPDYWIEYQYSQITTKDGILTEWATMPRALDSENLYYTESLPLFNWQIGTETATVCGYECIKATCHWRGRDFTAWFTPDIPVEYGPWKFGGLPGLIMKISDKDGIYTFEAVAVENGNFPIYAPRGNQYKPSTRDKVWKLQRALNENYFKAADQSVINAKTGRVISSRQHSYTQLEIE
ncbi:MAG: GLPGLI family protein [Bacteroides sp.]|nr:GLPGLI family protein [Bacteroides sp.]